MTVPRTSIIERLDANADALIHNYVSQSSRWLSSEVVSPFRNSGESGSASPFIKSMFPEIKLASILERSLGTALGWGWDKIVAQIAEATYGNGAFNHDVMGPILGSTLSTIDDYVASYTANPRIVPNTAVELSAILPGAAGPGAIVADHRERSDAFFVRGGVENYVEIKTPKPNYDQLRGAKRRILRIHALRARAGVSADAVRAFVGFPYNPNGRYGTYAWPTTRIFLDPSVDMLVGKDFWNYVGNDDSTYDELLDCFYEVGRRRRAELLTLL